MWVKLYTRMEFYFTSFNISLFNLYLYVLLNILNHRIIIDS